MRILEARGLSKIYREGSVEVAAVRDVSLVVEPGGVVAIMGPSGSGKTTLLSMLGCILRPTAGTVAICGERVWDLDERALPSARRRHVGFIFQSFNLFPALTAEENVEVALNLKGVTGRGAREEARKLLDVVGLGPRRRFRPRDLSGGEQQRVSIARALAGDPPLILADEPTGSLDWANGEVVVRTLLEAALVRGRAVIVVTHDGRLAQYVGRVLYLRDGRFLK